MTTEESDWAPPGEVVLDGTTIRSEADVHQVLAAALDFGPYYGHNLDALHDRLRYDVPRPVHLAWTDVETSRQRLGTDFDRFVSVFAPVAEEDARSPGDKCFTYSLHDREDPTSPDADGGWWFQVAICMGLRKDEEADLRLRRALEWIWARPELTARHSPAERVAVVQAIDSTLDHGIPSLEGVATLPSGVRLRMLTLITRGPSPEESPESDDWLSLCIPSEALERAYVEVARLVDRSEPEADTRSWREPLCAWLASVAADLHQEVPFPLALIGFEVAGSDEWVVDGHGTNSALGYVFGGDGRTTYQAPTHWQGL